LEPFFGPSAVFLFGDVMTFVPLGDLVCQAFLVLVEFEPSLYLFASMAFVRLIHSYAGEDPLIGLKRTSFPSAQTPYSLRLKIWIDFF